MNELAKLEYVGQRRACLLEKLGISSLKTLLFYLPFRYEDRRLQKPLSLAADNEKILFKATVVEIKKERLKARNIIKIVLLSLDDQREKLVGIWFWKVMPEYLSVGRKVAVYGTVRKFKGKWTMWQPEIECFEEEIQLQASLHISRIVPIYSTTSGLSQKILRQIIYSQLLKIPIESPDPYPMPADTPLPTLGFALRKIHFPDTLEQIQPCKDRIAYHEFFIEQLRMAYRKKKRAEIKKQRPSRRFSLCSSFLSSLPFNPTSAQKKAMEEIDRDLESASPMNRLLLGDVGSGKTLVAVYAAIKTVERGQNVLFMSPTGALASQHYLTLKKWLSSLAVPLFYIGRDVGQKEEFLPTDNENCFFDEHPSDLSSGSHPGKVFVGTHALLFRSFNPDSLGLVIIDEQHKFGVEQRAALAKKALYPDILTMTATPIPRTLALSLYGDLDFSILDVPPINRGKIITAIRSSESLPKIWEFMRRLLRQGTQAYVVFPTIHESNDPDLPSLEKGYEELKKIFKEFRLGMVHGEMPPLEREVVFESFRKNEIQLLAATSIIEVGIDIPNARIMVVFGAHRFGLAQLHQIRGRVGRGPGVSYCILLADKQSQESRKRLKILELSKDGFEIAKEDMKLRGLGEFFGSLQSGKHTYITADPIAQESLLLKAREQALKILSEDPNLSLNPKLRKYLKEENLDPRDT
ncbi:ATP-dependent DNA helicase RecG [Candidatus Methylacidiphilum infernorum]|uniref:Probable DNA 3'-5' helicase RecG n=1 Tax=Candidatus Methylacidiphilum infernorum TaxID=511746 RepID=A0ABX7PVM4_9BACT|nr:ATP-dependent DNA helicase RecG [Candidatus Methylacidiphilum infernorum]QSR87002.1 ATP-dependent DNA helicase RecG [Candidatus Methylacidiphilum infernorum]